MTTRSRIIKALETAASVLEASYRPQNTNGWGPASDGNNYEVRFSVKVHRAPENSGPWVRAWVKGDPKSAFAVEMGKSEYERLVKTAKRKAGNIDMNEAQKFMYDMLMDLPTERKKKFDLQSDLILDEVANPRAPQKDTRQKDEEEKVRKLETRLNELRRQVFSNDEELAEIAEKEIREVKKALEPYWRKRAQSVRDRADDRFMRMME